MTLLYSLLGIMLAISLFLLGIAARKNKTYTGFFVLSLIFVLAAFELYHQKNDTDSLHQWLAQGQQHYQLQMEVNQLGGINHIIQQIKERLVANPQDAQGWFVLGKLYLALQQNSDAKAALTRAHQLKPDDKDIKLAYLKAINT